MNKQKITDKKELNWNLLLVRQMTFLIRLSLAVAKKLNEFLQND